MTEKYSFELNSTLSDMIEQRHYELNGLKSLIGFALSTTEYEIPKEKIIELQQEYAKTLAEYDTLKESVTKLIPDEAVNEKTSWTLDFKTHIVTVYEEA